MTESELIRWIRNQKQDESPLVLKGVGDDCAVLDPTQQSRLVVSTDVLVEGVHFRRRWMHPYFLGRKALLVNLSDLAAMGATPTACLLTLTLPSGLAGGFFRSFMGGFLEEVRRWKTPLVGGDLSRGSSVHVGVTIWGHLETGEPVYRSTAAEGDAVVLVGDVGLSAAGLNLLKREDPTDLAAIRTEEDLAAWAGDSLRWRCLKAHFLPNPQIRAGDWLRRNGFASAMIDVSDGLRIDVQRLAAASGLRFRPGTRIRLEPGLTANISHEAALTGGEDYALLAAVPGGRLDRLRTEYPAHLPEWRQIGSLGDAGSDGVLRTDQVNGFDHFGRRR